MELEGFFRVGARARVVESEGWIFWYFVFVS